MNGKGVGIALVACFLLYVYGRCEGERIGAASERLKDSNVAVKIAAETVRVRDTIYRRDTIRFRSVLTKYDSTRVTDTLVVTQHDTAVVYIPRAVADTAIQVCRSVILSCESRVAARDNVIIAKDSTIAALKASKPSGLRTWLDRALWLSAGAGLHAIAK